MTGYATDTGGDIHGFFWDGTTMQDLGTLGGSLSVGDAINAAGQITGAADTSNGEQHAFLWDGATMQDLGTLGGRFSAGNAINASGQITGHADLAGFHGQHAFLWDGSTMHDLNALIDAADPLRPYVTLGQGIDINDRGQIVANGFDRRVGLNYAYLVSPAISLEIEKHADLTEQGAVVVRTRIVCGPFAGVEDFQETLASAAQDKTGAEAEGGIDGTVVCDGVERTHTAHRSSLTEADFKPGPAGAGMSVSMCVLVGDEQSCFSGNAQRRVIIRGGSVP